MKKKLILIGLIAALLIAGILLAIFLWPREEKPEPQDPKPPVVETDTSAFSGDFFGTWELADQKETHSLSLLPNGYGIYKNGSKVDTVRYSSDANNCITAWIDGYVYEFKLEGDTLVRYRKGVADGFIYRKGAQS